MSTSRFFDILPPFIKMPTYYECLLCGVQLSSVNETKEHIIPNALGGQLWTKNATCSSCNSKAGHSFDSHLVSAFASLANVFDVPRDRGAHPDAFIEDSVTGLNFKLSPGSKPVLAHNISYQKTGDGTGRYEFFASTKEAAEQILRNNLSKRKKTVVTELVGNEHSGEKYTLRLCNTEFFNVDLLRAIAKIATCYARHAGIMVPFSAVAPKFLRAESAPVVPVAAAMSDVVAITGLGSYPLHHAVFLYRPSSSTHLFAYVSLFHAFEFVVLVDENSKAPVGYSGYLWNIVTAMPDLQEFSWVAAPEQLLNWINNATSLGPRPGLRVASLTYWIENIETIWIQRAFASAQRQFQQRISEGASDTDALACMKAEMESRLSTYGLSILNLEIASQ